MGLFDEVNNPEIKDNGESDIESGEGGKKRRGRPKGSKNREPNRRLDIDAEIVSGMVNLAFGLIVSTFGNNWNPLPSEVASIASNLKTVLEKRLPDAAAENLPEFSLALAVVFYVTRVMGDKAANEKRAKEIGPHSSDDRL